jgi:hypothetical protein
MKTLKILRVIIVLVLGGVLISNPAFSRQPASASTPASECASTLNHKFERNIKYPEFAQKQALQGDVTVLFTVADDGKIIIKDIRTTDVELAQYIRTMMSTVNCPELDNAGVYDFKIIFHFKLI